MLGCQRDDARASSQDKWQRPAHRTSTTREGHECAIGTLDELVSNASHVARVARRGPRLSSTILRNACCRLRLSSVVLNEALALNVLVHRGCCREGSKDDREDESKVEAHREEAMVDKIDGGLEMKVKSLLGDALKQKEG